MSKKKVIEQAEQIHKLFSIRKISYEDAIKGLKECGYKELFDEVSKSSALKAGAKPKPFSAWHYLHTKIIYHS